MYVKLQPSAVGLFTVTADKTVSSQRCGQLERKPVDRGKLSWQTWFLSRGTCSWTAAWYTTTALNCSWASELWLDILKTLLLEERSIVGKETMICLLLWAYTESLCERARLLICRFNYYLSAHAQDELWMAMQLSSLSHCSEQMEIFVQYLACFQSQLFSYCILNTDS